MGEDARKIRVVMVVETSPRSQARPAPLLAAVAAAALHFAPSPTLAGELCLVPSADHGYDVTVECSTIELVPNSFIAYSTEGTPGAVGDCWGGPASGGPSFLWTLSSSDTDPHLNSGPLTGPIPGFAYLYLWLACSTGGGIASAEFDLDGTMGVRSFEPRNGFLHIGDEPQEILVATGGSRSRR